MHIVRLLQGTRVVSVSGEQEHTVCCTLVIVQPGESRESAARRSSESELTAADSLDAPYGDVFLAGAYIEYQSILSEASWTNLLISSLP